VPESRQNVQVARLEAPGVMAAAFSPLGTYLATFQRTRPEAGNTEKNLKVHPSGTLLEYVHCLPRHYSAAGLHVSLSLASTRHGPYATGGLHLCVA